MFENLPLPEQGLLIPIVACSAELPLLLSELHEFHTLPQEA